MTPSAHLLMASVPDVSTVEDLRRRMTSGETLHHGLAPGQTRESWWLWPSGAPVAAEAVRVLQAQQLPATKP